MRASAAPDLALAVAACTDDVHGTCGGGHRLAFGAHHGGGGGVFVDRLATCAQRHQQPADLGRRGVTFEQDLERGLGLRAGQRAVGRRIDQGFERVTHAGTCKVSVKFFSIACPCSDRMDSG